MQRFSTTPKVYVAALLSEIKSCRCIRVFKKYYTNVTEDFFSF